MKFKEGDRVRIKSLDSTGTIVEMKFDSAIQKDLIIVRLDNPSSWEKAIGHKWVSANPNIKNYNFMTIESNLELIGLSRPEPDWMSIWEMNE